MNFKAGGVGPSGLTEEAENGRQTQPEPGKQGKPEPGG